MAENAPAQVDFWFDPICPWCWITSRWIGEVQKVRNIEVTWRPFSLSMHNQGRDLPADYQAAMDRSWAPTRLITAVRELHGNEVIKPLYDALGEQIHHNDNKADSYRDAIVKALEEVNLPAELADVAFTDKYDEQMRASLDLALKTVGGTDVGVPLISINGTAFFGPVISPSPAGEEAGKLFDGALALASYPGFFELKRPRNVGPIFHGENGEA